MVSLTVEPPTIETMALYKTLFCNTTENFYYLNFYGAVVLAKMTLKDFSNNLKSFLSYATILPYEYHEFKNLILHYSTKISM
jgi:hypothetical protein